MNKLHYKTMAHSVPCKAGEGYVHFDGKEAECVICNPIEPPAMNTNHTPLPWHYGIASECIITPKGEEIASLASSDLSEKEDNARLIAQAPALLAALEDILDSCPEIAGFGQDDFRDAINTARAVIAQAKGETK